ncbi:uncharacterized protein BO80DRAFT_23185 [Aspergillus ibericus CBS 121593]|uniref:Uncharacterized protein n=1 Tax=Aspergillus ibericus CBS 121593 TaxID=1448316 RepID=A0A395H5W7_9EURO|nr:hypothetical protein BO80DRAFT_23185 [Aspergillus ibericus CBS 121593]RAL03013.1 hypothetical protein BO80DRAFT_23185 [Aspergillus ibericus CBS 121593]
MRRVRRRCRSTLPRHVLRMAQKHPCRSGPTGQNRRLKPQGCRCCFYIKLRLLLLLPPAGHNIMASIQSVLQAAALLSDISDVHLCDLLPHRHELQVALSNLQRLLKDGSTSSHNGIGTSDHDISIAAAESNGSESVSTH